MSTAQAEPFEQLELKIQKLIEMYEKEKSENELLRMEKADLQAQVRMEKERLKDIEEKYNKTKISKALIASSEDVHDAKLRVNRMVREIDKCIALLNR